MDVMNRNI